MDSQVVTGEKIKVEIIGDPAEIRANLANLFKQCEAAGPMLARVEALPPRQQQRFWKRFGDVDGRHAPFLARMLPPTQVDKPPVMTQVINRPRERRARRVARTTGSRGDPDPPESNPPLRADRLRHAEQLLAWSRSLEGAA